MRNLKLTLLLMVAFVPGLWGRAALHGWCEQGGQKITTAGIQSSTVAMVSYPKCTITVNIFGGGLATLYSDNAGTPLANPFTASNIGYWTFYADDGAYTVNLTGGLTTSLGTFNLFDSSNIAGGCGTLFWCQSSLSTALSGSIGIQPTAASGQLTIESGSSSGRITLFRGSAFGPNAAATISISALTGAGGGIGTINLTTVNLVTTATTSTFSGTMSVGGTLGVTGATTLNSTLGVSGAATVGSLVDSGAASVGTTLTVGSYVDLSNIPFTAVPASGKTRLWASSGDSATCGGSAMISGRLYYQDAGGNCFGPLATGGSSGTGWNVSTTLAGTNALVGLTYLGGNASSDQAWAFSQNGKEVGRMGVPGSDRQWFCIGCAANPAAHFELKDTTNINMAQFTGTATSSTADFYNVATKSGSLSWSTSTVTLTALGSIFLGGGFGGNGLTVTSAGRVQYSSYLDSTGVATKSACAGNQGSIVYDTTLLHWYFCENAGGWTQFGTGGTAGWLNGPAANAGLNTDASIRWIGLLNNFAMGFATNSTERMYIDNNGFVGIGTVGAVPNRKLEVKDTSNITLAQFTGRATSSQMDFYNGATQEARLLWSTSTLTMSALQAGVTIDFTNIGFGQILELNAAGRAIYGSSASPFTTGGNHWVTIRSSDYGQLALVNSGVGTARLTFAYTGAPTIGGDINYDDVDFNVTTGANATALLNLKTGVGPSTGLSIDTAQAVTMPVSLTVPTIIGNTTFNNNVSIVGTAAFNGPAHFGSSGSNITSMVSGSLSWINGGVAANSCSSNAVTVTGAPANSVCFVSPVDSDLLFGGLTWSGQVFTAGSCTIKLCNVSGSAVAAHTYTIKAWAIW